MPDTWFFWGDSVTLSVNDNEVLGGWVSRLVLAGAQKSLYQLPPATFYNLGARRQTIAQIATRFEQEYTARLMPGTRSRFVLCTGTVDALQQKEPDAMAKELSELLSRMKEIAPVLYICPPPLANEAACARLLAFASQAQEVCRVLNLPYVSLTQELMDENFVSLLTDGIHPGPEGNRRFAELLMQQKEVISFLHFEE